MRSAAGPGPGGELGGALGLCSACAPLSWRVWYFSIQILSGSCQRIMLLLSSAAGGACASLISRRRAVGGWGHHVMCTPVWALKIYAPVRCASSCVELAAFLFSHSACVRPQRWPWRGRGFLLSCGIRAGIGALFVVACVPCCMQLPLTGRLLLLWHCLSHPIKPTISSPAQHLAWRIG